MFSRLLCLLLFIGTSLGYAYTYSDYDVDGVEDNIDACPNTPFEMTVDENGCEEGRSYIGSLTFLGGSISSIDKESDNLTNFLLYLNYRYKDWDISVSTFNDIQNATVEIPNTFYVTTGYYFKFSNNFQTKVSIGTKQSSVQDDYYISSYLDYSISENQNLFLYYSYTYAQNNDSRKYNNFSTISAGIGRMFTDSWFSALSYDFSEATFRNTEDYKVLSWANTFAFSPKYYIVTNYSYGLNNATSDHTISVQFGVKFE
jgi:hypothetical protein